MSVNINTERRCHQLRCLREKWLKTLIKRQKITWYGRILSNSSLSVNFFVSEEFFYWGSFVFVFFFTSLLANLEEFSCKLSNSFPEMHANFVKFFQDTSKFQEMYRLCIFKKEFAKWIDRHSVFQLCSWKYGLQITWFSLPSFGDQSLDKKGLFYHTFHIHLSASLSNIIRSNYRIFKLKDLWVCVCVWLCIILFGKISYLLYWE